MPVLSLGTIQAEFYTMTAAKANVLQSSFCYLVVPFCL